jgi:hypothetical protein
MWSPAPFLLVIPVFMGVPVLLVLFLFVAIFCAWSPALFRGESSTPRRTTVLYVVFGIHSAASYASGWHYGIQYEGLRYTVTCAVLSTVLFSWIVRGGVSGRDTVTLTRIWRRSRKQPFVRGRSTPEVQTMAPCMAEVGPDAAAQAPTRKSRKSPFGIEHRGA